MSAESILNSFESTDVTVFWLRTKCLVRLSKKKVSLMKLSSLGISFTKMYFKFIRNI